MFGSFYGIVMIASVKKLLIKRADRPEIHEPEQGFDVCHGVVYDASGAVVGWMSQRFDFF